MQRTPLKNPSSPDGYESWPLASGAGGGASSARVSCSAIGASAVPFLRCRARDLVSNEITGLVKIKKEIPYCS